MQENVSKPCHLERHVQSATVHLKKGSQPAKCRNCFKPCQ